MSKINFREFDSKVHKILLFIFKKRRIPVFVAGVLIYALFMFFFKDMAGVSSNFFVLIPLFFTAGAFGLWGGILAGALALPANLLIFFLLNRMNLLPESLILSEIFGIFAGIVLGYLRDSFMRLISEMDRREKAEKELRAVLNEKDLLLNEIHHRIKNNLNLIKSLMQLQMNRSENDKFLDESKKLMQRIFSISEIHQQLFNHGYNSYLDFQEYIETLLNHLQRTSGDTDLVIQTEMDEKLLPLPLKKATPLGLIINEIFTNIAKYALPGMEEKKILVKLHKFHEHYRLEVIYPGPEFDPHIKTRGLGLKLIKNLTGQLNGTSSFIFDEKCRFILKYPIKSENI